MDNASVWTYALQIPYNRIMSLRKTATLNLRIDPLLKEAARVAAERDHRSVANLIELLIRRHCEANSIPIPEQTELFDGEDD